MARGRSAGGTRRADRADRLGRHRLPCDRPVGALRRLRGRAAGRADGAGHDQPVLAALAGRERGGGDVLGRREDRGVGADARHRIEGRSAAQLAGAADGAGRVPAGLLARAPVAQPLEKAIRN